MSERMQRCGRCTIQAWRGFGGPLMGAVGLGTADDPVLTGALLAVSSLADEQQKPGPV